MSGFSAWLNDIEGISAQQALKTGLPTKRVESWKYVPTRSLTRTGWRPATPQATERFALTGGRFSNIPEVGGLEVTDEKLTLEEEKRLTGDELIGLVPHFLHEFGLLRHYKVEGAALMSFLGGVKAGYATVDNPFHNFWHGFDVFHILMNRVLKGVFAGLKCLHPLLRTSISKYPTIVMFSLDNEYPSCRYEYVIYLRRRAVC